ncbi:MAG: carboxypeptidase-like regulatory domain-containing protein [Cyanobacteria bacterium J06623_4]
MQLRLLAIIFGAFISTVLSTALERGLPAAHAHGSQIDIIQSTEIQANFETGEPMSDAQVLIYAPADLQTPWITAKTDEAGRYTFTPDAQQPGLWEVTVRQAGHGHTTSFTVGEQTALANAQSGLSAAGPMQRWIAIAAIVWGFVGTALFFSGKASGGKA